MAGWITGYDTMEKGSTYLMETAAITREEFEKLLGVLWGISEGQYNTKWELVDERLMGEGTLESPILLQWAQDWAEG